MLMIWHFGQSDSIIEFGAKFSNARSQEKSKEILFKLPCQDYVRMSLIFGNVSGSSGYLTILVAEKNDFTRFQKTTFL